MLAAEVATRPPDLVAQTPGTRMRLNRQERDTKSPRNERFVVRKTLEENIIVPCGSHSLQVRMLPHPLGRSSAASSAEEDLQTYGKNTN